MQYLLLVSNLRESTDDAYLIDWGDGTTTSALGSGRQVYQHLYKDKGIHDLEISNCNNVTYCNVFMDRDNDSDYRFINSIIAYWSIGESQIKNISFYYGVASTVSLKAVGDVLKNDVERKSVEKLFYRCDLSYVYEGIFDNCPLIYNFEEAFYLCSKLSYAIPIWTRRWGKYTLKDDCFLGCTSATNWLEVPASWGGPASSNFPIEVFMKIKLFNNNEWYLNQFVQINNITLEQKADGSYEGSVLANTDTETNVVVNGVVIGSVFIDAPHMERSIFMGDCSNIMTVYDFTNGDLHDDIIVSKGNWAFDSSKGGLTSPQSPGDLIIDLPTNIFDIIFTQNGYGYYTTFYDNSENEITNTLNKEGNHRYITLEVSEGYTKLLFNKPIGYWGPSFTIEKIISKNLPLFPTDFIPSKLKLNEKLSLEQRIARIEQTLKLNNHANIQ